MDCYTLLCYVVFNNSQRNYYHGTNLSMLSFPSKEVPGELSTSNLDTKKDVVMIV